MCFVVLDLLAFTRLPEPLTDLTHCFVVEPVVHLELDPCVWIRVSSFPSTHSGPRTYMQQQEG